MIKNGATTTITKRENSGAWLRNAAIGIGVGGALYVGISAFFKGSGKKATEEQQKKSDETLARLPVKTYALTKDTAVYRMIADSIYRHLDDENHGGIFNSFKYDEIKKLLTGLNPEELRQVVKEFGYRSATVFFTIKSGERAHLFTWFEGVLDKDQQVEMRRMFQKSGMWGNGLTNSQKDAYLKSLWGQFWWSETTTKIPVFPGRTKLQNGIFINGVWTPSPDIVVTGYWQLGNLISAIAGNDGKIAWIKVLITNAMYPDLIKKERWIAARDLNHQAPTQDDPYNYPIYPIAKI
jgi:hypothetical protein